MARKVPQYPSFGKPFLARPFLFIFPLLLRVLFSSGQKGVCNTSFEVMPYRDSCPSSPQTSRVFTRDVLLAKLQTDVSDKVDISLAAHHMTYGVLLREIESLVSERQRLGAELDEARRSTCSREAELTEARLTIGQLEKSIESLKASNAEQERSLLEWSQRYERTQRDVAELRAELERTVKDADHNRQLLSVEVRNRAAMLSSMHDDIRSDLQRTLFVREGSMLASARREHNDGENTSPEPVPLASSSRRPLLTTADPLRDGEKNATTIPPPPQGTEVVETLQSPSSRFQTLHAQHLSVVESVRRQLACDVPRHVDIHNTTERLKGASFYNGAHYSYDDSSRDDDRAEEKRPAQHERRRVLSSSSHTSPSRYSSARGTTQTHTNHLLTSPRPQPNAPPPPPWAREGHAAASSTQQPQFLSALRGAHGSGAIAPMSPVPWLR